MTNEVVSYLAGWLLDHPEDLAVDEIEGERGATVLELRVHPEDVGKLIGRHGRTIHAVRSIARAAGQRRDQTVLVEIAD